MPKYDNFDLDLQTVLTETDSNNAQRPTQGSCACSPSGASRQPCEIRICCD